MFTRNICLILEISWERLLVSNSGLAYLLSYRASMSVLLGSLFAVS